MVLDLSCKNQKFNLEVKNIGWQFLRLSSLWKSDMCEGCKKSWLMSHFRVQARQVVKSHKRFWKITSACYITVEFQKITFFLLISFETQLKRKSNCLNQRSKSKKGRHVKVSFFQKVQTHLSFPQIYEPYFSHSRSEQFW